MRVSRHALAVQARKRIESVLGGESLETTQVIVVELELQRPEVFLHARARHGFHRHRAPVVEREAKRHLRRRRAVLRAHVCECLRRKHASAPALVERAVRLDEDVSGLAEAHRFRPPQARVHLDLVHGRRALHARVIHELHQVLDGVVGHADGVGEAHRHALLESHVGIDVFARHGPMHHHAVEERGAELLERAAHLRRHRVGAALHGGRPHLRREVELPARHARGRERLAHERLVLVELRAVQAPVAHGERVQHGPQRQARVAGARVGDALLARRGRGDHAHLVRSVAEHGTRRAVIQRDGGHGQR